MGRIMGIDYGLKRIGIAMTDIMRIMASPFDTIESSISIRKNAAAIIEIAKNNDVSEIVAGLPVNMDGSEGEMAETVRKFISEINLISEIPVAVVDERLTTAQAERMLIEEADVSRGKRKGLKDKISAAIILQLYLDQKNLI
ncbi:MAG: Holliday junction resolvase RuvX [Endomicrobia bacterium]|nr:Holliday junction resolvase RuvX [Endomicrobiia bacterium]MCL2507364.1 Holliday junction resolvase RuvX [Endomicrobiia bacterium]